jgi:hypothetical protein
MVEGGETRSNCVVIQSVGKRDSTLFSNPQKNSKKDAACLSSEEPQVRKNEVGGAEHSTTKVKSPEVSIRSSIGCNFLPQFEHACLSSEEPQAHKKDSPCF